MTEDELTQERLKVGAAAIDFLANLGQCARKIVDEAAELPAPPQDELALLREARYYMTDDGLAGDDRREFESLVAKIDAALGDADD